MVPRLLKRGKEEVGEVLSAFEFLDAASLGAIRKISPHLLRRCDEELANTLTAHSAVVASYRHCCSTLVSSLTSNFPPVESRPLHYQV
jgi:hypothetical protein